MRVEKRMQRSKNYAPVGKYAQGQVPHDRNKLDERRNCCVPSLQPADLE